MTIGMPINLALIQEFGGKTLWGDLCFDTKIVGGQTSKEVIHPSITCALNTKVPQIGQAILITKTLIYQGSPTKPIGMNLRKGNSLN